jgi:hypothetical protein
VPGDLFFIFRFIYIRTAFFFETCIFKEAPQALFPIKDEAIISQIFIIREQKVMLDSDLAKM